MQIVNQPIIWQQLKAFWHVDMITGEIGHKSSPKNMNLPAESHFKDPFGVHTWQWQKLHIVSRPN